jgi:hypothetical protein
MEGKELTTTDVSLMPLVNIEAAVAAWDAYQDLCKRVLDEKTDYANIKGKLAKKRSGFSKLARFYGVSISVLKEFEWHGADDWGWDWTLVATIPGGRSTTGDGSCTFSEMKGGGIAATRHNIRAKAYTRAFNRSVANVLGTGEVSAEELGDDENGNGHAPQPVRQWQPQKPAPRPAPVPAPKADAPVDATFTEGEAPNAQVSHWIKQDGPRTFFWSEARRLGFGTQSQVHAALHIEHMEEWAGTVEEAVAGLEQMIADTKERLP